LPPQRRVALGRKARETWRMVRGRFGARLSAPALDYLIARYVLGLTAAVCECEPAAALLVVWRGLIGHALTPEQAERALHHVPAETERWLIEAGAVIERLGRDDGAAVLRGDDSADEVGGKSDRVSPASEPGASAAV
jgi:hypothetical protein